MIKRKDLIEKSERKVVKIEKNEDILSYSTNFNLKFSDLDTKSRDLLMKEICIRIMGLEGKSVKKLKDF